LHPPQRFVMVPNRIMNMKIKILVLIINTLHIIA
jgi:hypothetical protein